MYNFFSFFFFFSFLWGSEFFICIGVETNAKWISAYKEIFRIPGV